MGLFDFILSEINIWLKNAMLSSLTILFFNEKVSHASNNQILKFLRESYENVVAHFKIINQREADFPLNGSAH